MSTLSTDNLFYQLSQCPAGCTVAVGVGVAVTGRRVASSTKNHCQPKVVVVSACMNTVYWKSCDVTSSDISSQTSSLYDHAL